MTEDDQVESITSPEGNEDGYRTTESLSNDQRVDDAQGDMRVQLMKAAREKRGPAESPRLPDDIQREVDRLLSELTISHEKTGRRLGKEDAIRLTRCVRHVLEHGGSIQRDISGVVNVPGAMIFKAQERFNIPVLTPRELQILEQLKAEAAAQADYGEKISLKQADQPKRDRMLVLKIMRRIERHQGESNVLSRQLGINPATLNHWEKAHRGKTIAEISPKLFQLEAEMEDTLARLQEDLVSLRGAGEEVCSKPENKRRIAACRKLLLEKSAVRPLLAMSAELNVSPETLDAWDAEMAKESVQSLVPEYFSQQEPVVPRLSEELSEV